jgi:hypothetical protein
MGRKALENKIYTALTTSMIFENSYSVIGTLPNFIIFLPWRNSPQGAKAPPLYRGFKIILRYSTVSRTPLDE